MNWENNARVLWHNGKEVLKVEQLEKMDAVISKWNEETTHENIQAAYDYGLPFILFVENDPSDLFDCGLKEANWPNDKNASLAGVLAVQGCAVAAYMISGAKINLNNGNQMPSPTWAALSTENTMVQTKKISGKEVFLYMDGNIFSLFKDDSDLQAVISLVKKSPTSFPDFFAGSQLFPSEGAFPKLPYDVGQGWAFWLHRSTADGILTIYNGTKEQLYEKIGYSVSGGGTDPIVEPDNTELAGKVAKLIDAGMVGLKAMVDSWFG